jgi:hypothetical protein
LNPLIKGDSPCLSGVEMRMDLLRGGVDADSVPLMAACPSDAVGMPPGPSDWRRAPAMRGDPFGVAAFNALLYATMDDTAFFALAD